MCQNCYFNSYNQQKRIQGGPKNPENPEEMSFMNKRDTKLLEKES
jgi:hypothetical protein